ncbi:hypothetical protein M8C21_004173, partial [Ambrosia artemisiifolia]
FISFFANTTANSLCSRHGIQLTIFPFLGGGQEHHDIECLIDHLLQFVISLQKSLFIIFPKGLHVQFEEVLANNGASISIVIARTIMVEALIDKGYNGTAAHHANELLQIIILAASEFLRMTSKGL